MKTYTIHQNPSKHTLLPPFSLELNSSQTTTIYSSIELQTALTHLVVQNQEAALFDYTDGLYERLTIKENLAFYRKWFDCKRSLSEILVMFHLHNDQKKKLQDCNRSLRQRVYFAKHYMQQATLNVFQEPIQGVDVQTVNTFISMLKQMMQEQRPTLVLVSAMEHALLLGDVAYNLQDSSLHEIETETDEKSDESENTHENPSSLTVEKLFKVPAKVNDKVILFDPTEIDYIESHEGKSHIVINDESFSLDSTLTEIEKQLEFYGFYRCHRSYIVNLQKVREIITWSKNTYSLKINNTIQATIPLSRSKVQAIYEIFNLK